jgi:hypothetical protein
MINLKILLIVASMFLVSCVSTSNLPLSKEAQKNLTGKTFVSLEPVKLEKIGVITPSNALDYSSGSISVVDHGIDTPSYRMISNLVRVLEKDFNMTYLGVIENFNPEIKTSGLSSRNISNANYIISVETLGSSIIYFPLSWARYKLAGSIQFKLISANGDIVSSAHCPFPVRESSASPTYDQLFIQEAKELKLLLEEAEKHCYAEFLGVLGEE